MFGYLKTDILKLSKENRRVYKAYYCGLCEKLSEQYGNTGRLTLSYDLTYLAMILTDINNAQTTTVSKHCPVHPLTKITATYSSYTEYAADMNLILNYYKQIDDFNDDNNKRAKKKADKLQSYINKIEDKYPEKFKTITDSLAEISKLEKENCLNPDLPANLFGIIMAEVFDCPNSNQREILKNYGFHLGRFIYLIDAVCDLKKDLKSGNYNPLVSLENVNFESMLQLVMEDSNYFYEQLEIDNLKEIIDNVNYVGLWMEFDKHNQFERSR